MPGNEPHQLPQTVRVLGKPFFITQPAELPEGDLGLCQTNLGLIQIVQSLRHVEKQDTILHELTHVISDLLGLRLTEKQVHGLAAGWHAILSDNPDIHTFLTPALPLKLGE
jgi:hypothetical protein